MNFLRRALWTLALAASLFAGRAYLSGNSSEQVATEETGIEQARSVASSVVSGAVSGESATQDQGFVPVQLHAQAQAQFQAASEIRNEVVEAAPTDDTRAVEIQALEVELLGPRNPVQGDERLLEAMVRSMESPAADPGLQMQARDALSHPAKGDFAGLRGLQAGLWTLVSSTESQTLMGEEFVALAVAQESPQARRVVYDEFVRLFPGEVETFKQRLAAQGLDDLALGLVNESGASVELSELAEPTEGCKAGPDGCWNQWNYIQSLIAQLTHSRQSAGRLPTRAFTS